MNKNYWKVIIVYILMQLSGTIAIPIILLFKNEEAAASHITRAIIAGNWAIISFLAALILTLYLLRDDMKKADLRDRKSNISAIGWGIGGVFLALFAQVIAANIEVHVFGIEPGSANTKAILELVRLTPLLVIVTCLIGPILEEIIFRKIIFGTLFKRYNFWIAGVISSILFAVVHMDFTHILLYTAMGLAFSFLYVKTKKIIVPIFAHVAMNSYVILIQTIFRDEIEQMIKQAEQIQAFIGGL